MKDEFYVRIGSEIRGPLTRAQVVGLLTQGLLSAEDAIGRSPTGPWTQVGNLLGLRPDGGAAESKPEAARPGETVQTPFAPQRSAEGAAGGRGQTPQGVPRSDSTRVSAGLHSPVVSPIVSPPRPRQRAASKTSAEAEVLSAAEIRRLKREARRRQVAVLGAALVGVAVGGAVIVWGVHSIRAWMNAQATPKSRAVVVWDTAKIQQGKATEESVDEMLARLAGAIKAPEGQATGRAAARLRWVNATEEAELGPVVIRVTKAEIGHARVVGPGGKIGRFRDPCVVLTLEITCPEGASEFSYPGLQSVREAAPILQDEKGRVLSAKRVVGVRFEGEAEPAVLRPGQTVSDVLVFDAPGDDFRSLRLSVPGEIFGVQGGVGFIIPREMIADARGVSASQIGRARLEAGDSAGEAARQAATPSAVPADEGEESNRIPIPGIHVD